eukprot:gene13390-16997_t
MTPAPSHTNRQDARLSTVVIADDSMVVRGLFARWLGESGRFHVVGVAGDGEAFFPRGEGRGVWGRRPAGGRAGGAPGGGGDGPRPP